MPDKNAIKLSASNTIIQTGDLVLIVGKDHKESIVRMQTGKEYQTHHGVFQHDQAIGMAWGSTIHTHLDFAYQLLPPSLEQLVRSVKRGTQILYPKDIGYMLMKMNIGPGSHVIEAGTGSGGLTLAMARMVMPTGHIYSYELRPDIQALAQSNLEAVGLEAYVNFKVRDIIEGFDEKGADVVFLDVREPWHFLDQAHAALKGGGFFGSLLPTTNQVSDLLHHLPYHHFGHVDVVELILRPYKAVPDRLRPVDRMVAHTGYLTFARALLPLE
ncbi:MAG: tRNA (adenine-N1)-methyltransferase [Anaerolineae bacterium]|nr:tRNA (adenine-N1)-methyltransferase [Anaerolineae bacterium]